MVVMPLPPCLPSFVSLRDIHSGCPPPPASPFTAFHLSPSFFGNAIWGLCRCNFLLLSHCFFSAFPLPLLAFHGFFLAFVAFPLFLLCFACFFIAFTVFLFFHCCLLTFHCFSNAFVFHCFLLVFPCFSIVFPLFFVSFLGGAAPSPSFF